MKTVLARTCLLLLSLSAAAANAQHRVDLRNTYERLLCVVPMVGAGTYEDPRRPMFAPAPGEMSPERRDGIIAFSFQTSDDGQFALVELVAADRAAFKDILREKGRRGDVVIFEKGKDKRADIEREFRKWKRDFDPARFGLAVE